MLKKSFKDLDFEDELSNSKSLDVIRLEFYKTWIKRIGSIFTILIIIILHFTIIYPRYLISNGATVITSLKPLDFAISVNWALFSFGIFSIFYLIKLTLMKYTPSFKEYITHEIANLDFQTQIKRNSIIVFLLLNCSSIFLLMLMELNFFQLNDILTKILFEAFLIILLVLSIVIPLFWGFFYDGLVVKLKGNYRIFIYPNYKIRKSKKEESKLIEIHLISNRIALNLSKPKKELFSKIAGNRWLPTKSKFMIFKLRFSPFLRFREFSTPINFQKKLLNIILALYEWDTQTN